MWLWNHAPLFILPTKHKPKHTTTMLFFICHIHIPGRFFLFFIKCEYFCNRFTGGIFKHWLKQIVKHNKEREERWEKEKSLYITHSILPCQSWLDMDFWDWLMAFICMSSISGLIISGLCLTIFSADHFIIPSMVIILIFLTLKKRKVWPFSNKSS